MRQQLVDVGARRAGSRVSTSLMRVMSIELGGLDETHDGRTLTCHQRAGEQPVLAPGRPRPNLLLVVVVTGDTVMIEWKATATVARKVISWTAVDRFAIRGGRMYEGRVCWGTRLVETQILQTFQVQPAPRRPERRGMVTR